MEVINEISMLIAQTLEKLKLAYQDYSYNIHASYETRNIESDLEESIELLEKALEKCATNM